MLRAALWKDHLSGSSRPWLQNRGLPPICLKRMQPFATQAQSTAPAIEALELSIVMPCLNEAETLESCIRKAQNFLHHEKIRGEVIVADNGSNDGSQLIAHRLGARVVSVGSLGYGNALIGGIQAATGKYVIMGDADDSYDF